MKILRIEVIEPAQKIDDGGFSSTGWTDQGYGFTSANRQRKSVSTGFVVFKEKLTWSKNDIAVDCPRII